jgi:hypothetical protein
LAELLVVLAILGLLAGIGVAMFLRLGLFSRNEVQHSARELYSMLKAARIYAATYRVDTGLAYGVSLKVDSVTGQAVEAIDAVALVYKMPQEIREKCFFFYDMQGAPLNPPVRIPEDENAYVPIRGEHERGLFRSLPQDTAVLAQHLLAASASDRSMSPLPPDTLRLIRIYEVRAHPTVPPEVVFEATLVPPLLVDDANGEILDRLPPQLAYLQALPPGQKYLAYAPNLSDPLNIAVYQDFRFPAHVFKSSGRMAVAGSNTPERFRLYVAYAPDADPRERFMNPADPYAVADPNNPDLMMQRGERLIAIDLYRATGRAMIARE